MKNILLAVCGLSPQVITETLFALHQQQRKVDAIHIITTRQGKEEINAYLLSPRDGQFFRYLEEYGIRPESIAFGHDHIHTVADANGMEIDDISGEEENELLLKTCLELAFHFTADPGAVVFFSIAGGRKTMSACLMVAAQFYGRTQDRVFHVLISPEFESNRDFYYPPVTSKPIELKDKQGQPYIKETRFARVTLAPVPFVSVRGQISPGMLHEPKDPATLMHSLVREEPHQLTVDLAGAKLLYHSLEMDMMPARLALYAFFALRKKDCPRLHYSNQRVAPSHDPPLPSPKSCRGCTDCFLDFQAICGSQKEITELYRKIASNRELTEMSDSGILGLTAENFNSYKWKIRKDIELGFGLYAAPELTIQSVGRKPDTRYGLKIDRDRIRLVF